MTSHPAGRPVTANFEDSELYHLAQRAHFLVETLHTVAYFAPEPVEEYRAYGLRGRAGYFSSRAAAMGPVPAEVITATFAIFAPAFVAQCMDGVWARVSPDEIQAARRRGVSAALHPVLAEMDLARALDLLRDATTALDGLGRPLYSAHAALSWPGEPTMDLWHAATLLREHRGDGHFAAVLLSALGPVETLVLHGAAIPAMRPFLQKTRGWADEDWDTAEENLRGQGLVSIGDGSVELTDAGRGLKSELERQTRTAALTGWRHIGVDGTQQVVNALLPVREALLAADIFPPGSPLRVSEPIRR
jgi:hypothetical protein